MEIRLSGIVEESIVDGKGIRFVVFTQGCPHNCKGCHNPQTHDFKGGYMEDTDKLFEMFQEDPILKGITFSGGEPFMQPKPLTELAKKVHSVRKDVTCYSGFTFEEILNSENEDRVELLKNIDVLIDGKFILEQRNLELSFRGSENQRVIDVKKSLSENKIILVEDIDY
ncbi:MAG: anaerobic ribonucleoside-triphosphate reductase activating protein [Clostridia bacterium]|nr:anaerobic ribonucleoside-triphosphate reductase activating protein [Clostridia bacterium]